MWYKKAAVVLQRLTYFLKKMLERFQYIIHTSYCICTLVE